jgi:hypothetical protein
MLAIVILIGLVLVAASLRLSQGKGRAPRRRRRGTPDDRGVWAAGGDGSSCGGGGGCGGGGS